MTDLLICALLILFVGGPLAFVGAYFWGKNEETWGPR